MGKNVQKIKTFKNFFTAINDGTDLSPHAFRHTNIHAFIYYTTAYIDIRVLNSGVLRNKHLFVTGEFGKSDLNSLRTRDRNQGVQILPVGLRELHESWSKQGERKKNT